MSKDDVEEYIREKMEDQRTLTADDLRGPVCARCGDELPFNEWNTNPDAVVIWDQPVQDSDAVYRDHFCSDECLTEAKEAALRNEDATPHGETIVVEPDEQEVLR